MAGRRIDPEPAEARRFPFERVPKVEGELHRLFEDIGVSFLVTSAACGADLLALKVAGEMSIPGADHPSVQRGSFTKRRPYWTGFTLTIGASYSIM